MSDASTDDAPVLDLLARMTADSLEASTLDPDTLLLVRLAALVAVGAPPVSYALNIEVGAEMGLDVEDVRGVLIAPVPSYDVQMITVEGQAARVLTAYTDLLVERGIRGATLEAVASRAGLSKSGLLHHFTSVGALRTALFIELRAQARLDAEQM